MNPTENSITPPLTAMNIKVTGDWVADWNLARPEHLPEGYFDGSLQSQLHHRAGGAWYVAHLIENVACRDLKKAVTVSCLRDLSQARGDLKPDGSPADDIAHAYSVWWLHKRLKTGEDKDKVWRIARFAGCRKASEWKSDSSGNAVAKPALLVVDDLGLGFSDDSAAAVRHITTHAAGSDILLKHGVRPDGSGVLKSLLDADDKIRGRLHVVASASALRRRNAAISRGLSWDRTLEDIEADFKSGPSSRDLARCATAVVHFGLAGAAVFQEGKLFRFYFLPDEMEGVWEADREGNNFGTGSVLTACMARHLIQKDEKDDYPVFFAVAQALAAQRAAYHEGGGKGDDMQIDLPYGARGKSAVIEENPGAACIAPPKEEESPKAKHLAGTAAFRTAWDNVKIKVWPDPDSTGLKHNRLLSNVTGTTPDSLKAKAIEVVIQGPAKTLDSVPKASYGKFITADRDEIESINEIRRLILEYRDNPGDKRPLSLAVFGAPGSGKSFAIKQIAEHIFDRDKKPLEFNLTQIKEPKDLYKAFDQVRDASIRLEIPLVFWDEFDTANLKWLADFLAPMQDADFFDGSHRHPFGKCIFVFAGGTCSEFAKFLKWSADDDIAHALPGEQWSLSFKASKGPDFISRLRGFLNVKGPNPVPDAATDPAYMLRRAILLRNEIDKSFPLLKDQTTGQARIAPNLLNALLTVRSYHHGARSLIALLSMSTLGGARAFTTSALPSRPLLSLHVSDDFGVNDGDPFWSVSLYEALARDAFEAWRAGKTDNPDPAKRYIYGPDRNDDPVKGPLTHKLIKEWDALTAPEKSSNYDPVWRRLIAIQHLGWRIVSDNGTSPLLTESEQFDLMQALLVPEHNIWLADHLCTGYELHETTRDALRRHTDIKPFADLLAGQQQLNVNIMTATLLAIEKAGYRLIHDDPTTPTAPLTPAITHTSA